MGDAHTGGCALGPWDGGGGIVPEIGLAGGGGGARVFARCAAAGLVKLGGGRMLTEALAEARAVANLSICATVAHFTFPGAAAWLGAEDVFIWLGAGDLDSCLTLLCAYAEQAAMRFVMAVALDVSCEQAWKHHIYSCWRWVMYDACTL